MKKDSAWPGVIEAYRSYLPVDDETPVVTLGEGGTPLVRARSLEKRIGNQAEIYLKYEGQNPTASFKDRGMTMAISKALQDGAKAVLCASTGNTSASASAYAARAGLKCFVILPEKSIATGKLVQALVHGAEVIPIRGNFDEALSVAQAVAQTGKATLVNSTNPYRLEGQKTGAFEICESLGEAPDIHCIPVGNAGNITAYWMGYKEFHKAGHIKKLPMMYGFQAAGAAPIVLGKPVMHPETMATAIRIGNPASWKKAVEAQKESKGLIESVTDDEILESYRWLAREEGVFCEPASAAGIAGILKLHGEGRLGKAKSTNSPLRIVVVLTGHGLKDPDIAIKSFDMPKSVDANIDAVLAKMGS